MNREECWIGDVVKSEASNLLRVPGGRAFRNTTPGANDSFPGDSALPCTSLAAEVKIYSSYLLPLIILSLSTTSSSFPIFSRLSLLKCFVFSLVHFQYFMFNFHFLQFTWCLRTCSIRNILRYSDVSKNKTKFII